MDSTLFKLAEAARSEMESFANEHEDIGDPVDLGCYCAIASYFLKILARKFGYNLTLVEGIAFEDVDPEDIPDDSVNHCWTAIDGKVVDITATQFGSDRKVHIANVGDGNYFVVKENRQTGPQRLKTIFKAWPNDQSPLLFINELKRRATRLAGELQMA